MVKRLEGKVAIVTGAGQGIGRAEAVALAAEGAKVVVNDVGCATGGIGESVSPAEEVVAEIEKACGIAVANYDTVATSEGGENIIQTALEHFGRLDILVNNAGIIRDRMIFNMSPEEWDTVIKVHLYGHFNCIRSACVIFRQQRSGRIINTASEGGFGSPGQANYAAAKEGIVGLTRTVAIEMARYGVTCNAIRPRATTRLVLSKETRKGWEKDRVTGRSAAPDTEQMIGWLPEQVAPMVVYLSTDEAVNINGHIFLVYGNVVSIYQEPVAAKTIYTRGLWTVDALCEIVPHTLAAGLEAPTAWGIK
jgi:NAD(P)-dependent dehydrogenase (short-subunit alcohol dehydrogenase family)